jgi:hypothetical protein
MTKNKLKINTLEDLKKWNNNPTNDEVLVIEWWIDAIFDDALNVPNFHLASQMRDEMIKFTMIYEKMEVNESTKRVDSNISYWNKRSSKDVQYKVLEELFNYNKNLTL